MSWYYAENNERHGPIEEAEFQRLVATGTIKDDTLVWREGLSEWLPYSRASSSTAAPISAPVSVSTALPAGTEMGVCSESGKVFPRSELIEIDGRLISAEYKDVALQRLREGVPTGDFVYAGFWIRFGAKFLDGILMNVVSRLVLLAIGFALTDPTTAPFIGGGISLILNAAYVIFFTGKYGATLGKMACKIQVIRPDGAKLTFGRATGRYFAELLSSLTLLIGYIMAAFDDEKRALHDRIADTRVVRKQS